jgi:hypothetical protein
MWTEIDRRIGVLSAAAVGVIGLFYVATGLVGVAMRPAGSALLAQVDPWLAILEILIIFSAIALVVMMAAVYAYASPTAKLQARVAFAFTLAFALLTCATHFANLTVGRQLAGEEPELAHQLSFGWPTVNLALDLLAWDLLLGIALLFAAPVFRSGRRSDAVRRTAYAAGALCLVGLIGPLSGRMEFQLAAIAGYAFVMPVLCVMIARLFARTPAAATPSEG